MPTWLIVLLALAPIVASAIQAIILFLVKGAKEERAQQTGLLAQQAESLQHIEVSLGQHTTILAAHDTSIKGLEDRERDRFFAERRRQPRSE